MRTFIITSTILEFVIQSCRVCIYIYIYISISPIAFQLNHYQEVLCQQEFEVLSLLVSLCFVHSYYVLVVFVLCVLSYVYLLVFVLFVQLLCFSGLR
jgi:uncharacterized membrane protein YgdD (TMEM256/DUF423 family)